MSNVLHTLTFRLTLWYAAIFAVSSLAMFFLVHLMLTKSTEHRIDQLLRSEAEEFGSLYRSHGIKQTESEFSREAEADGTDRVFFRLLSLNGEELAASDLQAWKPIKVSRSILDRLIRENIIFETLPGSSHTPKARIIYAKTEKNSILQIGYMPQDEERFLDEFQKVSAIAIFLGFLLATTIGWFMARRALAGMEQVRKTAISIGKGDLTQRVMVRKTSDEIDQLAMTFNTMLDRIQTLVKELKEVINNIAHDLRSPITRIRGMAETALTGKESIENYRDMAGMVVEESDRLGEMINTMLQIAETDAGVAHLNLTDLNFSQLVQKAYELFQPVAKDQGVTLKVALPTKPLLIEGDNGRLQRVIANLVDNAVKFTAPGGTIFLSAKEESSHLIFSVTDNGAGIPKEDVPHIFDRFYRGDRSRTTQGNGLGLSLARSFVQAHRGEISVKSSLGSGTTLTVLLPRSF